MGRVDANPDVGDIVEPNVGEGWMIAEVWRAWPPPHNAVRGELAHQDALVALAGPPRRLGYLIPVEVTFERDLTNARNPWSWSASVDETVVGVLDAEIASLITPDLARAVTEKFTVAGVVRGGSTRTPTLGVHVWLGRAITPTPRLDLGPRLEVHWPPFDHEGEETVRTGLSSMSAWADVDLRNPIAAIHRARDMLSTSIDHLDRHFAFVVLEEALYQCRDAISGALDDFDETCSMHDFEMDAIRPVLVERFGGVPVLSTYRQMAIRRVKQGDPAAAAWWCRRGLKLYGTEALRRDAVDDLRDRLAGF